MDNDLKAQLSELKKVQKYLSKHNQLLGKYSVDTYTLENAVQRAELSVMFNIDLSREYIGGDWMALRFGQNLAIGYYDGKTRSISWSDDGRQPKNEWLLHVSFPTGAYSLSSEYPTSLFQEMFLEFKSFEPKYCDTTNNSLYFDSTKAKAFIDAYHSIFDKYKSKVSEWKKEDRLKKLKAELKSLENNIDE